ncbi:MAG: methylmalonyl Co-A mutase-associated GTPase MeaB [Pseudomonadota bacterium]|nr:methylmalonyl Co-A mutase-associated GTPase MeaB [Pseudomonadota bacterium]
MSAASATNRPEWIDAFLAGERKALARAITLAENEGAGSGEVLDAMRGHLGRALTIGFTGPPGAGKSTLVNAFVHAMRKRDMTVGVVAVDPSSPISGGAILGDRIRMTGHSGDAGVFIRSLASRGHLGGLSRTAVRVIDCMDAAGMDVVVIETVGAGQSEVEIAGVADVKVVVAAPGLGDDVQAIKAGILEIADVLVVNKGDHPLAPQTVRHLKSMVALRGSVDDVPVLKTTAMSGEGVDAQAETVIGIGKSRRQGAPQRRARRLLRQAALDLCRARLDALPQDELDRLTRAFLSGENGVESSARRLLAIALESDR